MSPLHIFVYDKISLHLLCIFHVLLLSKFSVLKILSSKFDSVKTWFPFPAEIRNFAIPPKRPGLLRDPSILFFSGYLGNFPESEAAVT